MLFNSIEFLIFFPVVTLLFYLLPHRHRWLLLLAASCFFYMWFIPKYILILLITILIDYSAGILIEKWDRDKPRKKTCLVASIVSTCLVLFIFKYLNFCSANLVALAQHFGWAHPQKILNIALPIGLSFHTFQSLSYVIEVYRGNQKAERHFGYYALYVMFYPQLVTGPIERPQNLLRQLHEDKELQYDNIANGLRLILFGLFLKMVVADNLGTYVDKIYADPFQYSSGDILLGMLFYSFQIYGDFFGYSSIALGCARAMGFTLIDNFNTPYLAGSVQEFWRRWHISLSTWFRDYLYIPLGGSRCGTWKRVRNTFAIFLVSGLWHGANWTFVAWGAFHAALFLPLLLGRRNRRNLDVVAEGRALPSLRELGAMLRTFLFVLLGLTIFRAQSIGEACRWFRDMADVRTFGALHHLPRETVVAAFAIVALVLVEWFNRREAYGCARLPSKTPLRWGVYFLLLWLVVFYTPGSQTFIYFQF